MFLRESLFRRPSAVLLPGVLQISVRPVRTEHQLALLRHMISPRLQRLQVSAQMHLMYPQHMRNMTVFFHETLRRSHLDLQVLDLDLPSRSEASPLLIELLASCRSLRSVRLGPQYESAETIRALGALPRLENLALTRWKNIGEDLRLLHANSLVNAFPMLKTISADHNCALSVIHASSSNNIRSIHVYSSTIYSPTFFDSVCVVRNLSLTLTSVKIVCSQPDDVVSIRSLIHPLACIRSLRKLQLEGFIPLGDYDRLRDAVSSWPQLQILRWWSRHKAYRPDEPAFKFVQPDVLVAVSKSCPNVREIDLPIVWSSALLPVALASDLGPMLTLQVLDVAGWQVDLAARPAVVEVLHRLITSSPKLTLRGSVQADESEGMVSGGFWKVAFWMVRNFQALRAAEKKEDGTQLRNQT